ncbi:MULTISPECIES: condensation domain-containing protein [Streptomyces]|uniref:condensation domain-containing protein n=1 Tax=Streptomyces TaxID=1883 RepID=UPI0016751F6D|nr:condensation domain-containing protein [Streptomyces galilaeus]
MHELTFQSHRGDAGPTTWGQREQWETVLANRPHDHRFNEPFLYSLPRSLPLSRVLASLGALVERHEGLRTAFLPDGDGDGDGSLRQAVVREGSVRVPVVEAGTRSGLAEARELMREASSRGFVAGPEFHARLALVVQHGRPRWLTGALSHLVIDRTSMRILERDFRALLDGADSRHLPPITHQPLDQAAAEQSPQGQARLETTLRRWRSGFESAPRSLFRTTVDNSPQPGFPAVELYAKGLGTRAQSIATKLNVRPSAVFVAAGAAALAWVQRLDRFGMIMTCSNRKDPRTKDHVGPLAQQGLVPVETGTSFYDMVTRIWPALLLTYRTSSYDLSALDAMFPDVTEECGTSVDHFVNFMGYDEPLPYDARVARLADGESVCERVAPVPSTRLRFGLFLDSDGDTVRGRMFGNGRYVDAETMHAVLCGVNDLLLTAANGDVDWPVDAAFTRFTRGRG